MEEAHLPNWEMWICTTSPLLSLSHIFGCPGYICHCPWPANQGNRGIGMLPSATVHWTVQFQGKLRDWLNIRKEVRAHHGGETRIASSWPKGCTDLYCESWLKRWMCSLGASQKYMEEKDPLQQSVCYQMPKQALAVLHKESYAIPHLPR